MSDRSEQLRFAEVQHQQREMQYLQNLRQAHASGEGWLMGEQPSWLRFFSSFQVFLWGGCVGVGEKPWKTMEKPCIRWMFFFASWLVEELHPRPSARHNHAHRAVSIVSISKWKSSRCGTMATRGQLVTELYCSQAMGASAEFEFFVRSSTFFVYFRWEVVGDVGNIMAMIPLPYKRCVGMFVGSLYSWSLSISLWEQPFTSRPSLFKGVKSSGAKRAIRTQAGCFEVNKFHKSLELQTSSDYISNS